MADRYQVIVVGGGPVGAALAVELGLRGIKCALIERRLEPQQIPKGQNLTQRTLEHFYFWGIVDELRAARVMPNNYPIGGVTAYKHLMSEYWYVPPGREVVQSYYYETNDRLPQYKMEAVLRKKMATLPSVAPFFGWTAQEIEQDANGVRVVVAETRRDSEARYDWGGFTGPDTPRALDPELQGYWMFFGRVDVGEGWFFHAPAPEGATTDNYDLQALLNRAAGFEFNAEFEHVGFWDLKVAVAEEYQAGRVFIAGDAAHSHPPYGGFGLNNGIEDVVNLGWKLSAVLNGWGGDRLLDSYSEERRPIFWETGEDFIAAGIRSDREFLERYDPERDREEFEQAWKEMANRSRVGVYEPHYEGSTVVWGPPGGVCSAHGRHTFIAQPGHHLPPSVLSSGRGVQEELGAGFTLLAFGDVDEAVNAFEQAAQSLSVPLKVARDSFEDSRAEYGAQLVLVRPDQYVVWTGSWPPSDAAGLLNKVVGRR